MQILIRLWLVVSLLWAALAMWASAGVGSGGLDYYLFVALPFIAGIAIALLGRFVLTGKWNEATGMEGPGSTLPPVPAIAAPGRHFRDDA